MNIYRPFVLSDDYAQFEYQHPDRTYFKTIFCFLGIQYHCDESVPKKWEPIPVRIESGKKSGDFPSLAGDLTFSKKVYELLSPIVSQWVELLSLICDTGEYFLVKVREPTNCLDYSRAKVSRFKSGRVYHIKEYKFYQEEIAAPIFRLPETNEILVTDEFKKCVESNQLVGLEFKLVDSG